MISLHLYIPAHTEDIGKQWKPSQRYEEEATDLLKAEWECLGHIIDYEESQSEKANYHHNLVFLVAYGQYLLHKVLVSLRS